MGLDIATRLNLGCGKKLEADMLNIDIAVEPRPGYETLQCDLLSIPLPDQCANHVQAIHVFEHFYEWDGRKALIEWRRLMRPGAALVLELPNLLKCCKNILTGFEKKHPGQMGMWGLYGDPRSENPYMHHRWGYSPETLSALLDEHGFTDIRETVTRYHSTGRDNRDMRIECRKR